jgi:trigger factor
MQVQVAETGPCSRTLTITVPSQLVDSHLDQMFESARKQIQIKGFRPGKVPKDIIQKRFGEAILSEAKEQMLNRFFGEACRDQQITPVGRIEVEGFETLEVKAGAPLQFTAKIDVRPQFELGEVKGLEVEGFEPQANDTDVDNALKEIAHQKRTIQPTAEAAQDGDFVRADTTFVDASGNVVRERKGVQLNTRIAIHGCDENAYTQALLGAVAGKAIEIPITFPDTFEQEAVRGQTGTVKLLATEILRVTPAAIDDALAQSLEFADLASLRQDLQVRISSEKQRLGKARQEEQCLQKLFERHQIAVPPSLIDEQKRASLGQFAHRLKENGASDEEIQKKLEESQAEAQQDAERRVRLFFLIEAVAKQQKLFVTETDVDGELRAIAQANSNDGNTVTPAMVREHLEKQNQLGELRLALLERKVRDFLRENAKIVDTKAS